jgi:hypothetical protein
MKSAYYTIAIEGIGNFYIILYLGLRLVSNEDRTPDIWEKENVLRTVRATLDCVSAVIQLAQCYFRAHIFVCNWTWEAWASKQNFPGVPDGS